MGHPVNARRKKSDRKEREKKLDQAIEMTFPASDPIAVGLATSTEAQQGRPVSQGKERESASRRDAIHGRAEVEYLGDGDVFRLYRPRNRLRPEQNRLHREKLSLVAGGNKGHALGTGRIEQ